MKFTKAQKIAQLYANLERLGFTSTESAQLIRIERTLQRWGEAECGGSNEHCSWAIERDERDGLPSRVIQYHTGTLRQMKFPVPDREAGALRRLKAIIGARDCRLKDRFKTCREIADNLILPYHQSDPRGCALYLITRAQLGADSIDSCYTRGLAVCL